MSVLFRLLSRLPPSVLHWLGGLAGWMAYLFSPVYRGHLRANLARGLEGAVPDAVRREAIASAGRTVLELAPIWCGSHADAVKRIVAVSGREHVDAARAAGRGILYLTPHLGCFEISAQFLATLAPITVLYRPPKQRWLQAFIEGGRARGDCLKLAPADLSGVRRLIGALRKNEAVGLLPDQAPGAGEGKWLPFFGRPAYTMTLAARLSETGAAVIFVFAERLPGGRGYHLHFRVPSAELAGDTLARAVAINREVEAIIRGCPGQYLWGYNRYKQPAGAEAPPA